MSFSITKQFRAQISPAPFSRRRPRRRLAEEPAKPASAVAARVQDLIPEIEAYVESGMKGFDSPGLALGIVADDKLIYAKGFGVSGKTRGAPVDPRTIFQIGSTTKGFLATHARHHGRSRQIALGRSYRRPRPRFPAQGSVGDAGIPRVRPHGPAFRPAGLCKRLARRSARHRRDGPDPFLAPCRAGLELPHDLRLYQHHAYAGGPDRREGCGRAGLERGPAQ